MQRNDKLRLVYSEEEISRKVDEIAEKINETYQGEPLVAICVLKGAFMFFSDLVKRIKGNVEIDFMRAASYGGSSKSSGVITITKDVETSLTGKHVLLVEDVVDSGYTMDFLMKRLALHKPKSLRLAAFVDKKERREVRVSADFYGYTVLEGFIVGYGLDFAEKYRNLPAIYVVEE